MDSESNPENAPVPISEYRGRPQPPIDQRLGQIHNFLADEDYYRCFAFIAKLREIVDYIQDLEAGDQKNEPYDKKLLKNIRAQIDVHNHWIEEATKITSFKFDSPQLLHNNRLMPPSWKPSNGSIAFELEDIPKYPRQDWASEAKLHITLEEDSGEAPAEKPDPFEYTKKIARYREQQELRASICRPRYDDGDILVFNILPQIFKGPWVPPTAEDLSRRWGDMNRKLMNLKEALVTAYQLAPRPALAGINKSVDEAMMNPQRIGESLMREQDFTNADINTLTIFTKSSSHQRTSSHLEGSLGIFVNRVDGLFDDYEFWPEPVDSAISTIDLFNKVTSMGPMGPQTFNIEGAVRALKFMVEDGNIRYDGVRDQVKRPFPNRHPEHNVSRFRGHISKAELVILGQRLASAIIKLTNQLARSDKDDKYMDNVIIEYTHDVARKVQAWEKKVEIDNMDRIQLVDIAKPLAAAEGVRGDLTEVVAVALLQEKITDESNKNREIRATPKTIWNWTREHTFLGPELFSVRRWSPEKQRHATAPKDPAARDMVRNEVTPAGHRIIDVNNELQHWSANGRDYISGGDIFPFGETNHQETVIGSHIYQEIRNLKNSEFQGIYRPQGTGSRKRPPTDDLESERRRQRTEPTAGAGMAPS